MKVISTGIILVAVYFAVLTQGSLFRERRHDSEIEGKKSGIIHSKVGIPLLFEHEKRGYTRTGIPEFRYRGEDDDDEMEDVSRKEDPDDDDDDDDGDDDEKDKEKNPEELGKGYERIGDMGSDNKDDEDDKDSEGSSEDIMNKAKPKKIDLNADFPPTADQVDQLPKDEEMTPDEANKKANDAYKALEKKGYVQFTIKQKYAPELMYKESAAYKILSGNTIEDVERALKAKGVVTDVLFREAKNVGGPPYRSKVQVFLKLDEDVSTKRLKNIVDYGLINGMITIPGSFNAV